MSTLPLRQRLSYRLVKWALLITFALGTLLGLIRLGLAYLSMQNAFEEKIQVLAEGARGTASLAILKRDHQLAEQVIQGLLQYEPIHYVILKEDHGDMFMRRWRDEPSEHAQLFIAGGQYSQQALSDQNGKAIGQLIIYANPRLIEAQFISTMGWEMLQEVGRALLLTVLILWLVSRMVSQPLSQMAMSIQQMDDEALEQTRIRLPTGHQQDELGLLARATNTLLNSLQSRSEEREQLLTHMEQAKQAAEAANMAKSRFMANMSHELRTPLNAIMGYSEIIKDELSERGQDDLHEELDRILFASENLLKIVNSVLDMSNNDIGQLALYEEIVDIDTLLHDLRAQMLPQVLEKGNDLQLIMPPRAGHLSTDANKLRQCLLNLLDNANKFTEQGVIELRLSRETEDGMYYFAFTISDNGIGIASEDQESIFQAFAQADVSSTRKYDGTGLGLALVQRFVGALGGQLSLQSHIDVGTCMTIRLPCRMPERRQVSPQNQVSYANQHQKSTVLVIDDDSMIRTLLQNYMHRFGYQAVTAPGGEEGLRLAQQIKPALITLDIMMPDMDGWLVLNALRTDPSFDKTPIVVISALEDERQLALERGANAYLSKPVNQQALQSILHDHISSSSERVPLIMMLEEDDNNRDMLGLLFNRAGWDVCKVQTAPAALSLLEKQEPPDLIVLDLVLPDMDGEHFIAAVKAQPAWANIPLVILTAKDLRQEERQKLEKQVVFIAQKGTYQRTEFVRSLRKVLEQNKEKDAQV